MGFFEWLGQNKEAIFGYLLVAVIALQIGRILVYGPELLLKIFLALFALVIAFYIMKDLHRG